MSPTISSTTQQFQDFIIGNFYSRRLLQHTLLYQSQASASAAASPVAENSHDPSELYTGNNSFDANVVMVLSVLLCALICSLGLNSIIRCALRCSNLVANSQTSDNSRAQLAKTGVKKKALKTFLIVNYSSEMKLPGLDTECVICLSEFAPGERVRLLPKCNHGFHVRCIDRWLTTHSSCPTCRHCLIETCQKIVGCSQASSSQPPIVQESTIVNIAPLEPEALIRTYRGSS